MISALLFAAAITACLVAGFWLVPLIWLPVAAILLAVRHLLLGRNRLIWLTVLFLAVVACPILVFEGGLLILPSAVTLLIADTFGRQHIQPSLVRPR